MSNHIMDPYADNSHLGNMHIVYGAGMDYLNH